MVPGLSTRVLEGRATLERLLGGEAPGSDDVVDPGLFRSLGEQPVVVHGWEGGEALFPMPATSASMLGAIFSVPLEQAWAVLPATERLVPMRVTPRRAAILFFAFDVRRGGMGAYRELGVALPVVLDAPKPPAPLLPAMWRDPALGLYNVELPVDSRRPAEAGASLYGLPRVLGDAELEIHDRGGSARFAFGGQPMARLDVRLSRWPRQRRLDLSFQRYSLLHGRIVRSRFTAVGEGYRGRRGEASVEVGDHRRAHRVGRLELGRRPLELRVVQRMNWIAWGPEDVGAA